MSQETLGPVENLLIKRIPPFINLATRADLEYIGNILDHNPSLLRPFQAGELVRRGRHPSLGTREKPVTTSVGVKSGAPSPTEFAGYFPHEGTFGTSLQGLLELFNRFIASLKYPHYTSATTWQMIRFLENESTKVVRDPYAILLEIDEAIGAERGRLRAEGDFSSFRAETYRLIQTVKPPSFDRLQKQLIIPMPHTTGFDYTTGLFLTGNQEDALHCLDMIGKVANPFTRALIQSYLSGR